MTTYIIKPCAGSGDLQVQINGNGTTTTLWFDPSIGLLMALETSAREGCKCAACEPHNQNHADVLSGKAMEILNV